MQNVGAPAPEARQTCLQKLAMIGLNSRLANPDNRTAPDRGRAQGKARHGGHVTKACLADLVYARHAETKRKLRWLGGRCGLAKAIDTGHL